MTQAIGNSSDPLVVVIGGGFAGLELAKKLGNQAFRVLLLDKHNYHTFQPLLYQVATGGLGSDAIAYPLRKVIAPLKNVYFRMAEVKSIKEEENKVITDVGEFAYDYLVIATGSTTNFFGNSLLQKSSMPLKSIPEALDIRSYLLQEFEKAMTRQVAAEQQSVLKFVIVGGGPTGVELAGAMAEIKKNVIPSDYSELDPSLMSIHLIEAGPRILAAMSETSAKEALRTLQKMGVDVRLNTLVTSYDGKTLELKNGESMATETVIWSAGVMGQHPEGLKDSAIVGGNRILVGPDNRIKDSGNIYAIGDVACMVSDELPKGHPMVAPVAVQQARHLVKNLIRLKRGKSTLPFAYHDKGSMATIGRNRAVVDLPKMRFKGWFAWYVWMFVHLIMLIGFRNRIMVFVNWAWNYFSYERAIRLIIRPYKRREEKGV